jgi:hypothetical protein
LTHIRWLHLSSGYTNPLFTLLRCRNEMISDSCRDPCPSQTFSLTEIRAGEVHTVEDCLGQVRAGEVRAVKERHKKTKEACSTRLLRKSVQSVGLLVLQVLYKPGHGRSPAGSTTHLRSSNLLRYYAAGLLRV